MKNKLKIELTWKEIMGHYFSVILLAIVGFVFLLFQYYIGVFGIVGLILLYLYIQNKRLYYKVVKANITNEVFEKAINFTSEELDWQPSEIKNGKFITFRNRYHLDTTERIEIKKVGNKIYINSIKNPNSVLGIFSEKRNSENVLSFLLNTGAIVKEENVEEQIEKRKVMRDEEFWNESEWTIGKIFMRIIGYGLTLLFLLIGVLVLWEVKFELEMIEGVFSLIMSIFIGWTYIKNDIEIIREKRRRKNKTLTQ